MRNERHRWLVETEWLAQHLTSPDVVVVDASWHMPATGRSGRDEHLEKRIPGAVYFDIDEISDEKSSFPHMLPSTVKFSSRMRKLGVGDGARIVVYDSLGLFSAPRVWWMLRVMGKNEVAVLNGGLPKWLAEAREIEDGPPNRRPERHFTPRVNGELLRDRDDVAAALGSKSAQVVDARPAGRFEDATPSRARACPRATCPAPATCRSPASSPPTARSRATTISPECSRARGSTCRHRSSRVAARA